MTKHGKYDDMRPKNCAYKQFKSIRNETSIQFNINETVNLTNFMIILQTNLPIWPNIPAPKLINGVKVFGEMGKIYEISGFDLLMQNDNDAKTPSDLLKVPFLTLPVGIYQVVITLNKTATYEKYIHAAIADSVADLGILSRTAATIAEYYGDLHVDCLLFAKIADSLPANPKTYLIQSELIAADNNSVDLVFESIREHEIKCIYFAFYDAESLEFLDILEKISVNAGIYTRWHCRADAYYNDDSDKYGIHFPSCNSQIIIDNDIHNVNITVCFKKRANTLLYLALHQE